MKEIFADPRWAWVAFGSGAAATLVAVVLFSAIVFLVIRSSNKQVVAVINRALEEAKRMPIRISEQYQRIENEHGKLKKEITEGLEDLRERMVILEDDARRRGVKVREPKAATS